MLTKGDEYPIHQTADPIAFSGTDRNFYDRYFFCAYRPDGGGYCAAAFGVYPHLNVADAHFCIIARWDTALRPRLPLSQFRADGPRRRPDPHRGGRACCPVRLVDRRS